MKVIKNLLLIWKWIFVQILGRIFYDKKYLTGRWFSDGLQSKGWNWAARDIQYRLRTLNNLYVKWPVSPDIKLGGTDIVFHPDDLNNMNGMGNYFQTLGGKIVLGKGTYIGPNVGIITANHDLKDPDKHQPGKDVLIGRKCWIGMNSVIMPGVVLGDHTVVGAGSVVTKSFEKGHCLIVGSPARRIKDL